MLSGYPCARDRHSLSLQVMNQAGVVTEKVWCNFVPTLGERLAVLAAQDQLQNLRQRSKVPPETNALFRTLLPMLTLLVAVLLEKTSRNSSLPPSAASRAGAAPQPTPPAAPIGTASRLRSSAPNLPLTFRTRNMVYY